MKTGARGRGRGWMGIKLNQMKIKIIYTNKSHTYAILAYVQLTVCCVVQTFRPFSRVGNSKSIIYAGNSVEIVDCDSSK